MKSFIAALVQTVLISLAIIFTAFLIPTPLFCIVILVLVPLALLIRWLVFKKNKGTIFLTVFSIIALLFFALCLESNPYTFSSGLSKKGNEAMNHPYERLTQKQALRDLDFAMHRLKKIHPAAHEGLPKRIASEYEKVHDDILQKDQITKFELAQKIEGILSLLNDAHTNIYFSFSDAHYLRYIYQHIQAKDEFVSLNGKTKEQIFKENRSLFSTENDEYGIAQVGKYLAMLEGLSYLGIKPEEGKYKYEFRHIDGSTEDYLYSPGDFVPYEDYVSFNNIGGDADDSDKNSNEQSFVHYEIDKENKIGTFTLTSCIYNKLYKETTKSFFDEIKSNGIQIVIVDLRNNAGGNSLVINEFLRYTSTDQYRECACDQRMGPFTRHFPSATVKNEKYEGYNFSGKIYVLTSVQTFSSAMMFAMCIQDNNLGLVAGEASGNNPSSYGDVVTFRLPESRLYMQVSWKKWYRIDESKDGQLIEPDIPVKADDALSYVTELIAGPKISAAVPVDFENAETDTEADSTVNE